MRQTELKYLALEVANLFPPKQRYSQTLLDVDGGNEPSPAELWERDLTKRALDELFALTTRYKASSEYQALLQFVARFRRYSPFNAMLVHIQRPGATFVAPAHRWLREYGRTIKPGSRPLVILQPMGPVMFVFDVSDTAGKPLPPEIEKPFEVRGSEVRSRLPRAIENCKRDGVKVYTARFGSQQAASISRVRSSEILLFKSVPVRVRYVVELDQDASAESRYASLVHEVAHLYCGHLGSPNRNWWSDRRGLARELEEFEAESVAYLVCKRLGIDTSSEKYLAGYVQDNRETPPISLECVMKAAGLIETMGVLNMKPRSSSQEA